MAARNYYLVLGVSPSETSAGIRARYRDLARALHPDIAGVESTGAFQEISEAYQVLVDPAARQRYNEQLAAMDLRAPTGPRAARGGPVPRDAEPPGNRASFEELLQRVFGGPGGRPIAISEPWEQPAFEVILTPKEAARGVEVPIGVPLTSLCPACEGAGRVWVFPCRACGERGVVEGEQIVRIPIPPLTRSPAIIELRLGGMNLREQHLRLHVRIE